MMRVGARLRCAALVLAGSLAACASDRAGWSRDAYRALHESPTLQIRHSMQRLDREHDELRIGWVGARTPEGQAKITSARFVVFDDIDGDGRPSANEILKERESRETTHKVLFSEVHVPLAGRMQRLRALVEVRTEAERRTVTWKLAPD